MVLTQAALAETRQAFDGVALTYRAANDANPILCAMRARTLAAVRRHTRPGARLLDLGCGPGPDVLTLAREGYHVTGLDWSPAMAGQARAAVDAAGLTDRAAVHALGIHELDRLPPGRFEAAYSNLGALNCVPDLRAAARAIARRLAPGGVLVASVIGRVCPWEWLVHARRADWPRIRLRFARGFVPVPLEGHVVWMQYLTPSECLDATGAAGFSLVSLRALGVCVPPPCLEGFCRRHPHVVGLLQQVEDGIAHWPLLRHWGDHFLIVLRRTT